MVRCAYLLGGLALVAAATPAQAAITWVLPLTNEQESPVPTPDPNSFGTATLVLNDAMTELSVQLSVFNIDANGLQTPGDPLDNLTNAHIHASSALIAATRPVVWGLLGTPFNNTMPNEGVFTPFADGVGFTYSGVWNAPEGNNGTTLTAQIDNILAGRAYINVHTVRFPAGEVRANIFGVPEPATWATLLFGLAAVGTVFRRRRRHQAVA